MRLDDALFNWLQIKVVADKRPDDRSAQETERFFHEILVDDHDVSGLSYTSDGEMYRLVYTLDGNRLERRYDKEQVESLLRAIEGDPSQPGCFFPEE